MEIIKQTTVYKCSHCDNLFADEKSCLKHELKCKRNPAVHSRCYSCALFDKDLTGEDVAYTNAKGEAKTSRRVKMRCTARDVRLYSPSTPREIADVLETMGWMRCPTVSEGCEHLKLREK
jgi:hypothetical protein